MSKELIEDLRNHAAVRTGYTTSLIDKAADALESQAREIADLQEEVKTSNECLDMANEMVGKLKGRIAALKAQPSGVVLSQASLTAAVYAAMVEMQNISPPLGRGECARLIRSAFARLNHPASAGDERDQLATEAAYYRSTLRNVLKDIRDDLVRGGLPPSWSGVAETISVVLSNDRAALSANHSEQVRVFLPKPLKRGDAEAERGEYGGAMARGYSAYERQLIRLNPGLAFATAPSAGRQGGDV